MRQYIDLLRHIMEFGTEKEDRTGTGTTSCFGYQMRFDLQKGFPLITTKKIHVKSIIHELLWFLAGDTNVKYLQDNGVRIWNEWRRPYSLDRPVTLVQPRLPLVEGAGETGNSGYTGDFSYAGLNAKAGSEDSKLADIWVRMMRRCYDESHHRYNLYGEQGTTVCRRWWDPATFIKDAKELPHWYYKQHAWESFELDKDYYGANQYGPSTTVWLHTAENNYYTKAANAVRVVDADGVESLYLTQAQAAKAVGVAPATMSRFLKNPPTVLKGNNKQFIGWEFEEASFEQLLLRMELVQEGDLGPVYGKQWRSWECPDGTFIDQISQLIHDLTHNPDSRRLIVNAWNVADIPRMAIPPCHCFFQFNTTELDVHSRYDWFKQQTVRDISLEKMRELEDMMDVCCLYASTPSDDMDSQLSHGHASHIAERIMDEAGVPKRKLDCQLYQRSGDVFLGVPFNIASYALLLMMVAQQVNMIPGDFIHTFGDVHIYRNHQTQVNLQLTRDPRPIPQMRIEKARDIFSYKFEDFKLDNYFPHPAIPAPVAV